MEKNDREEIAESGQISEHSDFIAESTLLPETESSIPETETIDNSIGDGLPGGSAHGVKASKAKKSFFKENAPFVIFGAIVLVAGSAFGYKKLTQPVGNPVPTVSTPTVPVAEPVVLPPEMPAITPVESVNPVPAERDSPSISPPDKSTEGHLAPELSSIKAGMPSPVQSSQVTQSSTPRAQEQTFVSDKPSVPGRQEVAASLAEKLMLAEQKLAESEKRVKELQSASAPPVAAGCAVPVVKKASQKKSSSIKKRGVDNRKAVREQQIEEAPGMNVRVIKNGLAWVQLESGGVLTVREGDSLPGLGKVKKIDGRSMQVFAGSKRIEQK